MPAPSDWSTSLPDAIDALVQALTVAPELEDVAVWDGPVVTKATQKEILAVGFSGVEGDTDAEATTSREGLGGSRDRESFTIRCAAAVLIGTTKVAVARRRAYEIVSAAGAVLARNRNLDGTVMRAQIGTHSLGQEQTSHGAQVIVTFGVDCDAFTRR